MTQIFQQSTKKIKGKVTDMNGSPIIGATIYINSNAKAEAITDVNGEFSLETPEGAVVNITYVGYEPLSFKVNASQMSYSLKMREDAKKLNEVVVVGYGVQKKVTMTGAVANVKSDELTQIPNTNLSNSLAGRAPGATITGNSGLMELPLPSGCVADSVSRFSSSTASYATRPLSMHSNLTKSTR